MKQQVRGQATWDCDSALQRSFFCSYALGSLLLLIAFALGCQSEQGIPLVPVEGSVTFSGMPIPGALVVLHPKPESDPRIQPARGSADENGKFKITTFQSGDGAAIGQYAITVVSTPLVEKEGDFKAGPNVLPTKYSSPTTTDLTAEVAVGGVNVIELDLKR